MKRGLAVLFAAIVAACGLFLAPLRAAEVMPPPPRDHFNDYAGIVAAGTARQLDDELAQFERDTSNQIVVAIFPKMQSSSSVEDYATRVFQSWGVGQKGKDNGAVLFVFRDDHKVWIQTGYGLEGAIPDARAKQIVENEITPRFRSGDFTGGLAAGTRALMAAAKGEYRGTGQTNAEQRRGRSGGGGGIGILPFFFFFIIFILIVRRRNTLYGGGGRRSVWVNNTPWWGGGGGGGGGWSSGGGGGSFSGGGGSTGGGGAGGSW